MSRARSLLRPEEEVVFHNNPGPVWLGLPLAQGRKQVPPILLMKHIDLASSID